MRLIIGLLLLLSTLPACQSGEDNKTMTSTNPQANTLSSPLYFGTYTQAESHVNGKASGIYIGDFFPQDGSLQLTDSISHIINPSFVALSQDRKILYAVSESGSGKLFAYHLGEAKPSLLGQWPTAAAAPCHIAVGSNDQLVIISNYMGGVVNIFHRNASDSLHEIQRLQLDRNGDTAASHAHAATFSPDKRFVFINDLGKDKIWAFRIDTSALSSTGQSTNKAVLIEEPSLHWLYEQQAEQAGPRHFTFHPSGRYAYVVNELNATLQAFAYESSTGQLSTIQTISTLPDDYTQWNACADIHAHPNGRFLYASNRGHNSIACYEIEENGQLKLLAHTSSGGEFPRNFAISPNGKHLLVANQNSDNVLSFAIDPDKGTLRKEHEYSIKTPVCIAFH